MKGLLYCLLYVLIICKDRERYLEIVTVNHSGVRCRHGSVEITDIRPKTGRIAQPTDQNELNLALCDLCAHIG